MSEDGREWTTPDEERALAELGRVWAAARDEGGGLPGYIPLAEEFRVLARHWAGVRMSISLMHFFYGWYGSSDWRRGTLAYDCLEGISQVIGDAAVQQEVDRVQLEEAHKLGPDLWETFCRGDADAWAEVAAESDAEHEQLRRLQQDARTQAEAFAYLTRYPSEVYFDAARNLWSLCPEPLGPGDNQPPSRRLILKVTTPRGVSGYVPERALDRPPRWYAAYGLR